MTLPVGLTLLWKVLDTQSCEKANADAYSVQFEGFDGLDT